MASSDNLAAAVERIADMVLLNRSGVSGFGGVYSENEWSAKLLAEMRLGVRAFPDPTAAARQAYLDTTKAYRLELTAAAGIIDLLMTALAEQTGTSANQILREVLDGAKNASEGDV